MRHPFALPSRPLSSLILSLAIPAAGAGRMYGQTVANGNFDSGTFPSNGNNSLNFGAVTLGGSGKAAYFDTSNSSDIPTSWSLAAATGDYGYWLNNTGTPQSPQRYVWLGGNENCQANSIGGLTGGQTYRFSVSLAGWQGTLTDTTQSKSWTITQNAAALEVVTTGGVTVHTDASSSLVGTLVAQGSTEYAEFNASTNASASSLTWKTASVLVTLPAGVTSFAFYLSPVIPGQEGQGYNSSNGLFADSVAVSAVPEPSTWAAAASLGAMAGFGLWRRTRRQAVAAPKA